jgi:hypothetical protein
VVADVEVRADVADDLRLAAAEADQMANVGSSRVAKSMPSRVSWPPKQLADTYRWMCCA